MAVDVSGGTGGGTAAVPAAEAEAEPAGATAAVGTAAPRTSTERVKLAGASGGTWLVAAVGEKAAWDKVALGEAGTEAASYTIWAGVDEDAAPVTGASTLAEAKRRDRLASPAGLAIGSGSSSCVREPSVGAPGSAAGKTAAIRNSPCANKNKRGLWTNGVAQRTRIASPSR